MHCEKCGVKNQGQIIKNDHHLTNAQLPVFNERLTFFKKHKQGITNAFRYSFSNGVTEGLNNKIKVIKRVAYGYRNFYHFRSGIYSIQGLIFSEHEKEKQANISAAL
ncbi:transposase [Enterococcus sp. LJL51]|uniref:transposase n=1 Tax=Enterococcus sp. LJL51 TaxID=3416656 RepID=UPI003CF1A539